MADLNFDEDAAAAYLYDIAGKNADVGKKAVSQWFARQSIPPYAIFNIAFALDVDVAWLGGSDRVQKEKAIQKGGVLHRELERVARIKASMSPQRTRRTG